MMNTDKEAIIRDLTAIGNDIYAAFNGKPAKVPAVNPRNAFFNGLRTLNPFGTIIQRECKNR